VGTCSGDNRLLLSCGGFWISMIFGSNLT
jgi:hypothetical protein